MFKRLLYTLSLTILVAGTQSVFAYGNLQPFQNDASDYDIVSNCDSVDQCFSASGTYGANYSSCKGFQCYTCGQDAATQRVICAKVRFSASCSCSIKSSTSGNSCTQSGSCTVGS